MKKNIGTMDKALRVLAAGVIITVYFLKLITGLLAMLLLVLAAGLLLTGLISFCPFYFSAGIRTRKSLIK